LISKRIPFLSGGGRNLPYIESNIATGERFVNKKAGGVDTDAGTSSSIKILIIRTASPSQNPSFPGLTGESRKALDARLRPAGMTRRQ
jgi:hypothetical protein